MNKKYAGPVLRKILLVSVCSFVFINGITPQEVTGDYRLRTVVIDAGHGGRDPGAVGKKGREKDVVLAIALKLGAYVEERMPDIKVIYTRKTDVFVPLDERAQIANSNKADLFISIHANGNNNTGAYGTETLLLGYNRAGENFEVAKQENSVILYEDDYATTYEGFDPSSPESYIMFSLMQERYFERSVNFAALVQDQFRERARRKDRGVYRLGLLVLARTAMPGVLIETGFITNPDEEAYLMSATGQDLIASAIFRAFRDYRAIVESKSSFASAAKTTEVPLPAASGTERTGQGNGTGTTGASTGEGKQFSGTAGDSAGEGIRLTGTEGNASGRDTVAEQERAAAGTEDRPGDTKAMEAGSQRTVIVEVADNKVTEIEFKVQVTASSRAIALNDPLFEGFGDVSEFKMDNLYKYAVGGSSTYEEIMSFSNRVKERFPDAFVIGVREGQIIPLNQALKESRQNNQNN